MLPSPTPQTSPFLSFCPSSSRGMNAKEIEEACALPAGFGPGDIVGAVTVSVMHTMLQFFIELDFDRFWHQNKIF